MQTQLHGKSPKPPSSEIVSLKLFFNRNSASTTALLTYGFLHSLFQFLTDTEDWLSLNFHQSVSNMPCVLKRAYV